MIKPVLAGLAVLIALSAASQAEAASLAHVLGIHGKGPTKTSAVVNGKSFNLASLVGLWSKGGSSYFKSGGGNSGSCGKPAYNQCSTPISNPCSAPRGNTIPASNCGYTYNITINITINIKFQGKFGCKSCSSCVCYGFA